MLAMLGGCGRFGFDAIATTDASDAASLAGPGVTVDLLGDGTGHVISQPPGIDCPGACAAEFPAGTQVTLIHSADAGSMFTSWGGVCPGGATCQVTVMGMEHVLAEFLLPRNYVFATSTTVVPGSLGSLAAGDAECMARASASGLPGTYVAWLSSSTVNARDRVGAARGWMRLDQKPFVDTLADLLAGRIYYPVGFYDTGVVVTQNTPVVTGSSNGVASANCGDYATTTGNYASANPLTALAPFDASGATACTIAAHLYCFGIDYQGAVAPVPATGRLAFVSTSNWIVNGGFAGADGFCQADATAAGVTGTFRALLAGDTANAASRFDTNGPTWVRPDGVPLSATAADVMAGNVQAVLDITLAKTSYLGEVWTGAILQPPNGASTNTYACADWTDTVGTQQGANTLDIFAGTYFFGASGAISCTQPGRNLYCLEQ
jgi:hypothetical protein